MTAESDKTRPYHDLQQLFARHPLGAPDTDTFIEILKFCYEPEEAHLAAHMTWDLEPEEVIAKRAGMSLDEAAQLRKLQALRQHRTQREVMGWFLNSFVRSNELFAPAPALMPTAPP